MTHELYNELSKYIHASYRNTKNYQQEVDFILRRVGNRPGKKILIDVACGSGGMLNCSVKRVSVCIAFMTHTWKPGPFSVETITTPEFEVARVNKSSQKGSFGIVEIVFVIF